MSGFSDDGFHIVKNDDEVKRIVNQYYGNAGVEITKEQIDHLLNGGTLVGVINQEYTSTIRLKS